MVKREQYLENSGLVKTIMMLIIVAFHSIANWGVSDWFLSRSQLIPAISVLAEWMSSFHTSTFVFAAGFIFYSVSNISNHYHSFLDFEIIKMKRLLVPYVFVSLFWCIPGGVLLFNYSIHDVLKKYIFGFSPAQLWFLLMLFGVYSIFFVVNHLFRAKPGILGLVVVTIYAVSLLLRRFIPNIYMIWRTADMLPVFAAGFAFNKQIDKINTKSVMICSALAHIGFFTLYIRQIVDNSILSELIELVMHACGACFMFSAIASFGIRFRTIKESKLIVFFGKRSMPIYLIHQQLVWLLLFFVEDKISPYICMPLIFAFVLLLSTAISSLLLVYNPTRIMIGEKCLVKGDPV